LNVAPWDEIVAAATPALTERAGQLAGEIMQRQLPRPTRRSHERLSGAGKKGESR